MFFVIFTCLDHFSVYLMVFISFGGLEKSRNPRWPLLKIDDVIPISRDVINSFCGRQRKQFWTYFLPTKSPCHSFNALEVLKGGEGGGGGAGSKTRKNPRLIFDIHDCSRKIPVKSATHCKRHRSITQTHSNVIDYIWGKQS